VLRIAGWARSDVDVLALIRGIFPLRYFRFSPARDFYYRIRKRLGRERTQRDLSHASIRLRVSPEKLFRDQLFLAENGFRADAQVRFVNHHEAHALSALFYTDWDEGLIYTADGTGDNVSYSIRVLRDGQLECLFGDDRWLSMRGLRKNSLATAYGHATAAAGFRMWRHEGKLTGLSAFGEPSLADELGRHFRLGKDGLIHADFRNWHSMEKTIAGICRGHSRETIAASIQRLVEDRILGAVKHWLALTKTHHLALAGGLFANVRLNRLLGESLPLDEIFIFPAMSDEGLAVGAALCYLRDRDGLPVWLRRRRRLDNVYLGRDYDGLIDDCLAAEPRIRRLEGDPVEVASALVEAGKAGAIYVGRMEFGPRALGARSIIASATDRTINDRLNARLDRSEFMPFAPCVLEEDAARVFDITPVNRYAAHFMTITCAVKEEWRSRIPAVVHVDQTARPQIVREADNPLFAAILRRHRERTGVPILINSSFNVHEEPIVNAPQESRTALLDGRVDFIVTKQAVYVTP